MRVRLPRVPRRLKRTHARPALGCAWLRVRSVTGERTRLLIEVVRVRVPPDLLLRRVLSRGASRLTADVCTLHTSFVDPFRDRLAGRTLASEPRNAGSNPAPGTAAHRHQRATKTWRGGGASLSDNLAPSKRRSRVRCASSCCPWFATAAARSHHARERVILRPHEDVGLFSSEAEWSGSRLLTGDSEVRFLPLELPPPPRWRHCPCARQRAPRLVHGILPVRLRTWAPVVSIRRWSTTKLRMSVRSRLAPPTPRRPRPGATAYDSPPTPQAIHADAGRPAPRS